MAMIGNATIFVIINVVVLFLIAWAAPRAVPMKDQTKWAQSLSDQSKFAIAALTSIVLLMFAAYFRYLGSLKESTEESKALLQKETIPVAVQGAEKGEYGATESTTAVELEDAAGGMSDELAFGSDEFRKKEEDAKREAEEKGLSVKIATTGSVQGDYSAPWTSTFDLYFLIGMVVLGAVLIGVTEIYEPELWTCDGGSFWLTMLKAMFAQMAVGCFGGALARYFCVLDEDKMYVMTTPKSLFKVNYTRKLQHLAAYLIPLWISPSPGCSAEVMYPHAPNVLYLGLIQTWWAHFFTLLGFLALIKPLRESFTILMIQFNSMDRPEDRPNCLNWLVGGNVLPGYVLLIFLNFLFAHTCQSAAIFIVIYIVGLGDGLAEPVGVNFGVNKYMAAGCSCGEKEVRYYTRSWEGSATVFLSALLFSCVYYYQFANLWQFVGACILLPPITTYAEATAPHTLDTGSLIIAGGGILLALFWLFPEGREIAGHCSA